MNAHRDKKLIVYKDAQGPEDDCLLLLYCSLLFV